MTRILLLALPALILAGCGGGDGKGIGCTTDIVETPNTAYAGTFTGSFTPKGATAVADTLTLTVSATGVVTGTFTQSLGVGSGVSGSVTGTATDIRSGCDDTKVASVLTLTLPTGTTEVLSAEKTRNGTLPGSFSAALASNGATTSGTLVVATAASAG